MSMAVESLTMMLQDAKASLAQARTATQRLSKASSELGQTLTVIENLSGEIERTHAQLRDEVGTLTNAAPESAA